MTRSTFGPAYVEKRDGKRVARQMDRVRDLMLDGQWRTLDDISAELERRHRQERFPQGSVSAQLRHLKKARFGSFRLEKEYVGEGLYRYQLLPPLPLPQGQQALFDNARPARSHHDF